MKKITFLLFPLLIFFISLTPAVAQIVNPENEFKKARDFAAENALEKAISNMKDLGAQYPKNREYTIYLGRLYFWNKDYIKSKNTLLPLISGEIFEQEVLDLLLQVDLASGDFSGLLINSAKAIALFPENIDQYTIYRAIALEKTGETALGLETLSLVSPKSKFFDSAAYLRSEILGRQKNLITIGYLNTSFSNPGNSPWHLAHLEYAKKGNLVPYSIRFNYGNTYGNSALQGEIDAYPKVSSNSYLYFNAGLSNNNLVFPSLRLAGEYYYNFKKLSSSAGARYIKFSSAEVFIFTGSISASSGNYQLGYRPYLISESKTWFVSHAVKLRKDFPNSESYVQLDLQYGGLPYYFVVNNDLLQLNSYRAGINFRFRFRDNFFIQPILMYELEEFSPKEYRNRFNIQLNLSTRF